MANKLTMVGCGGTGSKLVERFVTQQSAVNPGFAEVSVKIIDSAKSDRQLPENAYNDDNTWNYKGMRGSGGLRSENAEAFMEDLPAVMRWLDVNDAAVVVSSASGGTGSTQSVLIVDQLLKQGKQVIVILVGARNSKQASINTRNTLLSFDKISKAHEKPVVVRYLCNTNEGEESVNKKVEASLLMLSVLFSGTNKRLDHMDLTNWLNYQKVTSFRPKLSLLRLIPSTIAKKRDEEYAAVITVSKDGLPTDSGIEPEYAKLGFVPDDAQEDLTGPYPMHFAILDGGFHEIIGELDGIIVRFNEAKDARAEKPLTSDESLSSTKALGNLLL